MHIFRLISSNHGCSFPRLCGALSDEKATPKDVQAGVAMSHMLALLNQLSDLADYSAEVFNGLLASATETVRGTDLRFLSQNWWVRSHIIPLPVVCPERTCHENLGACAVHGERGACH